MPIFEDQMTPEEMKKFVDRGYTCGECGGVLTVAWGGFLGSQGYILRCGNNVDHTKITKYNRKEAEFMVEARKVAGLDSTALVKMTEDQMLIRVGQSKFPKDLSVGESKLLAVACLTYGFDPIMHELTIFQGNPFVSVDGRYRKAQETGMLDGMECRPATSEERKAWEIPEGDKFFRAECYRKDASHPFVGWGRVLAKEMAKANEFTPLATNPQRMAEKRAEVQALRKAFHINLPSAEYIGTQEEEQAVDTRTGEIIDSTAREITKEKPEEKAKPKPKAKEESELFPETKLEPAEKDETPITAEQLTQIKELLSSSGLDTAALGHYCNAENKWGIRELKYLKKWQFDDLSKAFEEGKI